MPNGKQRTTFGGKPDPECHCAETQGDLHVCPYDEDINNNPDSECDCCDYCTGECAMDI